MDSKSHLWYGEMVLASNKSSRGHEGLNYVIILFFFKASEALYVKLAKLLSYLCQVAPCKSAIDSVQA